MTYSEENKRLLASAREEFRVAIANETQAGNVDLIEILRKVDYAASFLPRGLSFFALLMYASFLIALAVGRDMNDWSNDMLEKMSAFGWQEEIDGRLAMEAPRERRAKT